MNDFVEEGIEIDVLEDDTSGYEDSLPGEIYYEDIEVEDGFIDDVEIGVEEDDEFGFEEGEGVFISGTEPNVSSDEQIVEQRSEEIAAVEDGVYDGSGSAEGVSRNTVLLGENEGLRESNSGSEEIIVDSDTQSFYDFVTSYLSDQEHDLDDIYSELSIMNQNLEIVNNNLVVASQNQTLEAKYIIGVLFAIFGAFLIYAAFSKFS